MDVVQNAYLRSELRLGGGFGTWWGVNRGGHISAAVLVGSLAVPWIPQLDDAGVLSAALLRQPQWKPSMIVGPRDSVLALHQATSPEREPRDLRDRQPLMVIGRGWRPPIPATPHVRLATRGDLPELILAAAAMHREEMGVDPLSIDPYGWRERMTMLVDRGWSYVWMEGRQVVFKAELSAWTPEAVQLQGVYTAPDRRGTGVASAGLAAVCAALLRDVPVCSLYVNEHNLAARRLYDRLGFERWGEFATLVY
jgi:GNAT superfamily N-acetyltransferase